MSIQIGKAVYGKNSSPMAGPSWFYIQDNQPNIFRVLPPLKSMATMATPKVAKYHRVHRGLRGTDGRQKPFLCIEETDYKTRAITRRCPVCERARELERSLNEAAAQGASKEQLQKMRKETLYPHQSEGKYYLNVVTQDGKIGILSVGSKHYQAFDAMAKDLEAKGKDVTGMQGIFLNFKKTTQYKGDKMAVFSVEPYMMEDEQGNFRYVTHELTNDVINRLDKETGDLNNLFKTLSAEDMASIMALEGVGRAEFLSSLFEVPEKVTPEGGVIPGTQAQLVSTVTSNSKGELEVSTPSLPPASQVTKNQPAMPQNNTGAFSGVQNNAMGGMMSNQALGTMSDSDFLSAIRKK